MRTPTSSLLERELHIVQREHHIIQRELALLEHQRQLEELERSLAARERAIHHNHPSHVVPDYQRSSTESVCPSPSSLGSLDSTEERDKHECGENTCKELAQARKELIRAADTDNTDAFMAKFWALYQRESQRRCDCRRSVDVGAGYAHRTE